MNTQDPSQKDVLAVYALIKNWISNNQTPDASDIINLCVLLIKLAEDLNQSGEYKKNLVLTVLNKVINDSKLTSDAKIQLISVTNAMVPQVIDVMISIAHNEVYLGKKIKSSLKLFCSCF